jgi:hypothetical protein
MGLEEMNLVVHVKHFQDGFPLCWGVGQTGTFEASWNEAEITCQACLTYLKE